MLELWAGCMQMGGIRGRKPVDPLRVRAIAEHYGKGKAQPHSPCLAGVMARRQGAGWASEQYTGRHPPFWTQGVCVVKPGTPTLVLDLPGVLPAPALPEVRLLAMF